MHDPKGDLAGTRPHFDIGLERFPASEGQPPTFGIKVRASSVDEESVNAPYHFVIEAHAIVAMDGPIGDEASDRAAANLVGMQVVVGAIRERLADLTSRAPWGRFLMGVVVLPGAVADVGLTE